MRFLYIYLDYIKVLGLNTTPTQTASNLIIEPFLKAIQQLTIYHFLLCTTESLNLIGVINDTCVPAWVSVKYHQ